jgi:hypothetical protein
MDRFNLNELNYIEVKREYQVQISNTSVALKTLYDDMDVNGASENIIREKIKLSAKDNLGYYELKQHKIRFHQECSKFLDQRRQAKLQLLLNPSRIEII